MKKRIAAVVTTIFLALGLSGCERATAEFEPPDFNVPFTCTAKMTCGELDATAEITRLGDNMWETLFSEPSSLAGVKLCFYDDTVSASYKGLAFSVPKAAMPVESMMGGFIEAIEDIAKSTDKIEARHRDDVLEIEGTTDAGNYTMSFRDKGKVPLKFEMPSLPLCIEFECFSTDVDNATNTSDTSDTQTTEASAETTPQIAETTTEPPADETNATEETTVAQ